MRKVLCTPSPAPSPTRARLLPRRRPGPSDDAATIHRPPSNEPWAEARPTTYSAPKLKETHNDEEVQEQPARPSRRAHLPARRRLGGRLRPATIRGAARRQGAAGSEGH